jgi:RHS repeat-associated protein
VFDCLSFYSLENRVITSGRGPKTKKVECSECKFTFPIHQLDPRHEASVFKASQLKRYPATPTTSPTYGPTPTLTPIPTEEAPVPLQSATYLYDGDGNLVKSVVNSTLGHTTTTNFPGNHYSVEKKGGALKVQKHYTAGSTIIAVRTVTAEADTLQWMISDQIGSTSTTANADGTWNSDIRYTAFGEIRLKSGVTASGYRYTGQLDMQGSIGLDYCVSRFYDPYLNRWIQPDNIVPNPVNSQDLDRFAYVHNSPIFHNDPTGHDVDCGLGESGCKQQVAQERREAYFKKEAKRCAKEGGQNCPDYVGLGILTLTILAAPELIEPGWNLLNSSWLLIQNASIKVGVYCTTSPACLNTLNILIGVGDLPQSKPSPNEIGRWAEEQTGEQLPVIIRQFPRYDVLLGQLRKYDGVLSDSPETFTEIKTSLSGVVNGSSFIRNQVDFDANMAIKPIWIFVNSSPSKPLENLLQQSGIQYLIINVPKIPGG